MGSWVPALTIWSVRWSKTDFAITLISVPVGLLDEK